jgi:hypothetical protein
VGFLLTLSAAPVFSATGTSDPSLSSEAAGSWVRLGSGTSLNLNDVFGGAASTFAVGTNGTFLFFDGFTWQTVPTPTTSELHAVWAGIGGAIAVGDAGRILRFDGALSQDPFVTSANLRGVWGRSIDDVYAVGDAGNILHYDGTAWTRQISGTFMRLNDVWGHPAQGVFAVGTNGTIVKLDGDRWEVMDTPTTLVLNGIWASRHGVFAVGDFGTILSLQDGQWVRVPSNVTFNIQSVWIAAENRAYAVGDANLVLFYDGTGWDRMASGTFANLRSVNNGYAAGTAGTILQNPTAFREVENLRITEVFPANNRAEVTNSGPALETPDLPFSHRDDQNSFIPAGTFFQAGEIALFDVTGLSVAINRTDSDLWLYRTPPFSDGQNIVHGVKYGSRSDVGQSEAAAEAGKWPGVSAYTPAAPLGSSLAYDGFGFDPRDWYIDETPSPGEPNRTPVGSVTNEIVFPEGVQTFEDIDLGDEATAIEDWEFESTSGIPGIFTAHNVTDVNGVVEPNGLSERWLRVRDQDGRDVINRLHTATVEAPVPFPCLWTFDINLEEMPSPGPDSPAIVVQHDSPGGYVNTWGVVFRPDGAYLVVTDAGGNEDATRLYTLEGETALGEWVTLELEVIFELGVRARINGLFAGELAIDPVAAVDTATFRLAYDGSGRGNTGTVLIDDVEVIVDLVDPLPLYFTSVGATASTSQISLAWQVYVTEPIERFQIIRREGDGPSASVAALLPADARTFHDNGVRGSVAYHYVVTAISMNGTEVSSRQVTASLSHSAGVSFHTLNAFASGARVWLSWSVTGENDVTGYRLYRRETGEFVTAKVVANENLLVSGARAYRDDNVELWKEYEYTVAAVKADGSEVLSAPSTVKIVAAEAVLAQSSPNPFTALTRIEYTLPAEAEIVLNVYDVRGRLVATLDRGTRAAGVHTVSWDGRDNRGNQVSAGTYFYKLSAPDLTMTRKMVMIR